VNYYAHTTSPGNEEPLVSDQAVTDTFVGITDADTMRVAAHLAEERTDEIGAEYSRANAMKLLGYGRHLRKLEQTTSVSPEEYTLRSDLESERYFVVVQAYDLRKKKDRRPKLVWTLHLNMRSAGNNFHEAVAMMSEAAVNYFGRDVDRVDTTIPNLKQGKVELGEIKILGETP
jgi:hypothetical protein